MNKQATMTVSLRLPAGVLYDGSAEELMAYAENGSFGILPNHIDFVTALVPCVLVLKTQAGAEQLFGIDEGILVKHGPHVDICVRRAARGNDLKSLKTTIRESFVDMDEQERTARSALSRLEADIVRNFARLKDAHS